MNKDNKRFIIETIFLREAIKNKLSLSEFIVLMYFDNEYDQVFDVKKVVKSTCLKESEVLSAFSVLLDKKLITLNSVKDEQSGKMYDKICLDNLYKGIKNNIDSKEKEEKTTNFFNKFQEKFAHSLSSLDYEIISAWLSSGFSEDLIMEALSIAVDNNVTSLRYIDKILYEWKKKGIKSTADIIKEKNYKNSDELEKYEQSIVEYNWLDEG